MINLQFEYFTIKWIIFSVYIHVANFHCFFFFFTCMVFVLPVRNSVKFKKKWIKPPVESIRMREGGKQWGARSRGAQSKTKTGTKRTIIAWLGMLHPAIAADVSKQPGQEGVVADCRAIAHQSNMLASPCYCHVHSPAVANKPHCT